MKNFLITALVAGAGFASNAQSALTFRPFKFDISAGYALPIGGSTRSGGFLMAFEPKYAISDQISLGVKVEITLAISGLNADGTEGNIKASESYLATGDYYFTSTMVRPFAGCGVGIFRHAEVDVTTEEISTSTKFGFAPRMGVEIAHFRAAVEYNFAGKAAGYSRNYVGIKLGVLIGGGKIK